MAGRLGSRASIVLSAMAAVDSVLPYATVLFAWVIVSEARNFFPFAPSVFFSYLKDTPNSQDLMQERKKESVDSMVAEGLHFHYS